jgi:hypothetical protein
MEMIQQLMEMIQQLMEMIQQLMVMNLEGMTQTKARQKIAIISDHQALSFVHLSNQDGNN